MIQINKLNLSDKDCNQIQVLNEFLTRDEVSAREIINRTGISAATVSRVIKNLSEKNLIKFVGKEKIDKGRSPEIFTLNNSYGYMIHFYVTALVIYGYLIDLRGEIVSSYSEEYDPQSTLDSILNLIKKIAESLVKNVDCPYKKILVAGFSVPGVVDEVLRKIHTIPDVYQLSDTNFFDYAERVLGMKVIVNNVAWLSAVGEKSKGYSFVKSLCYLLISHSMGVGLGTIVDNDLLKGVKNYAGEIGQTCIDYNCNIDDYVQGKGQIEQIASMQYLYNSVQELLNAGKCKILEKMLSEHPEKKLNIDIIEKAAESGDEEVDRVLRRTVNVWALMVINIDFIINPEILVMGGSISVENRYINKLFTDILKKLNFFKPAFSLGLSGEKAQLLGGIEVLKEHVCNSVLLQEAKE